MFNTNLLNEVSTEVSLIKMKNRKPWKLNLFSAFDNQKFPLKFKKKEKGWSGQVQNFIQQFFQTSKHESEVFLSSLKTSVCSKH